MPGFWQDVKKMIGAGALAPALDLLLDKVEKELRNEVILFQATLATLEQEERRLGADIGDKKTRLTWRVLQFIDLHERELLTEMEKERISFREDRLVKRRMAAYQLLEEWEEKLETAENPGEKKRSENEIVRLKKIIRQYTEELDELGKGK